MGSNTRRATRAWRPPAAALADWSQFDVRRAAHRAALLVADADALWQGGHLVLAAAIDPQAEFVHHDRTLTAKQATQARALRQRLGLPE